VAFHHLGRFGDRDRNEGPLGTRGCRDVSALWFALRRGCNNKRHTGDKCSITGACAFSTAFGVGYGCSSLCRCRDMAAPAHPPQGAAATPLLSAGANSTVPGVWRCARRAPRRPRTLRSLWFLLDFDGSSRLFQQFLRVVGRFLCNSLLDRSRGALNEVLGFLETQSRKLTDRLDYVDLFGAKVR
jgi:hypothetical protein